MTPLQRIGVAAIVAACLLLSGCGASLRDYGGMRPELDLQRFLRGDLEAWGLVQNRSGKVVRHFRVQMNALWQGDVCTLTEHFVFSDGETQQRIWTISKTADSSYTGTAGDVIGVAQGHVAGNALQWRYRMSLTVSGGQYKVSFDDWMFLVDEGRLINRATIRKFGLRVGEVILFIQRREQG